MARRAPTLAALGLVVMALLAATALVGCGSQGWEKKCATSPDGVVECTPEQRPEARAVTGELLDGGRYDLTQDRGRVVVVNFWGSWCAPCRAEADDLEKTYQATKASGVSFLGVNWQDGRDAAKAFERGQVTYPSIFDPGGRVALAFQVTQVSTPSTLILDRQGRIAVAKRGSTTVDQLLPLVERIAAEPSSQQAATGGR